MKDFQFNVQQPLITWLDVERRFREMTHGYIKLPDFIAAIDCYSDGAEITLTTNDDEQKLHDWLVSGFGNSLDESRSILNLRIENVEYPIDIKIHAGIKPKNIVRYPLWHDLAYLATFPENSFIQPNLFPSTLHISAFHSFKGGVGRTTALITHLVAYLEQAGKRKTKVLLIDADIEAPGITYWLDTVNLPSISFVRFLEAIHYPPSSAEASLQYCAAELRKSSIALNGHEIFVLPACINPEQPIELLDTPVLPEHLARNTQNPWSVGDAIQQLAVELDAELVLIDLRAGLSELASPLLFDPRIERFIVSTIAPQSVNGIVLVLEKMALLRSLINDNPAAKPTVILSLLTQELKDSKDYAIALERINMAFPSKDNIVSDIQFIDAKFDANLMCIRDFKHAVELVKYSPLFNQIKDWVSTVLPVSVNADHEVPASQQINSQRSQEAKNLAEVCAKYIYAEQGEGENLLVTEPLRNLAKHYATSIPITISIGAKGAGKTFNFLQLCREKTWEGFLKKLGAKGVYDNETLIFPFLSSHHLSSNALNFVDNCRKNCFSKLNLAHEFSEIELRDRIDKAVKHNNTDWVNFWTTELLDVFQIKGNHLKELNYFLTEKGFRLVIIIDGLEDRFPAISEKIEQKEALKFLLDFPTRIESIRDSHLGIIEFIRSDYVSTVIQQNSGQFEFKYKPFVLVWSADSFLRLAYWICGEAKLAWAAENDSVALSIEELVTELKQLWGQKLGSTNSKEARTARWVFTALCDLNGRLQARDLVRFLCYAAQKSQGKRLPTWEDRVLLPDAIRDAVGECSRAKVKEAIDEIDVLKQWADKLAKIDNNQKSSPFNDQQMELTPESAKALQELGVIFEDRDKINEEKRFYLPEIYRTGLNFESNSARGRPRVLTLLQRNSVNLQF